jgi:hypothetical protein
MNIPWPKVFAAAVQCLTSAFGDEPCPVLWVLLYVSVHSLMMLDSKKFIDSDAKYAGKNKYS